MKNESLVAAVEKAISAATSSLAKIIQTRGTHGGCINNAEVVKLEDGREFFVKSNSNCPPDMFECESLGLREIQIANAIRVPEFVCAGRDRNTAFMVLECLVPSSKPHSFFEDLGRQLAELHRVTSLRSEGRFGFAGDNYIGSTEQKNRWSDSWLEFWRSRRFEFQIGLAKRNGYNDDRFLRTADRFLNKLDQRICVDGDPSLIHGDLWSGNYMVGEMGEPVLIDPGVYYGNREAEFGMTTLFGGFNERFYSAYQESWAFDEGADERIEIYQLYHLLNHLNLFGSSYMAGAMEIMNRYG